MCCFKFSVSGIKKKKKLSAAAFPSASGCGMGEKAHFSDRKMKNDFAVLTINLKTNHAAQGVRGEESADIPMSF